MIHPKKYRPVLAILGMALVWGCSGPEDTPPPAPAPAAEKAAPAEAVPPPPVENAAPVDPAPAPVEEASAPAAAPAPPPAPVEDPAPPAKMLELSGQNGVATVTQSYKFMPDYPWTKGNPKMLYLTRKMDETSGLEWDTAPLSGQDPLVIPASFEASNIKIRLSVNGKSLIEFEPKDVQEVQTWEGKKAKLEFHNIGNGWGVHGAFVLHLPEGTAHDGEAVKLGFKVISADDEKAWIGVRDAKNGVDF